MLARLRWLMETLRGLSLPADEPGLALKMSTCWVSVCVTSIREISIFEYQTQRLPSNWRQ
jgi:hypothetical protein